MLIALAERSHGHPISIDFFGSDLSHTAILHATEATERRGITNVAFSQANALHDDISGAPFDVVYCTLFLHHLDRENATTLLRRMAALARQAVLSTICDAQGRATYWPGSVVECCRAPRLYMLMARRRRAQRLRMRKFCR